MTQYTENDLRAVFAEHSGAGPVRPPRLEEIMRRGRRMRLRRRVAAGAALAGAAVAAVGVVDAILPKLNANAPASVMGSSARMVTGAELPETVSGSGGKLSLIHSETHRTMGKRVTVTFRPTSVTTGYSIRCADPKVWVLVRSVDGMETDFGRCGVRTGEGLDSQHDEKSVAPGWLQRPQTLEIWVFPSDAPIAEGPWKSDGTPNPDVSMDRPYDGCKTANRKKGTCDGKFVQDGIEKRPERVAAKVGSRTGAPWSVGIYDKPTGS